MSNFWIKLHHRLLDDHNFGSLPEFEKWRAIELFLAAGEEGSDGLLPSVEHLAWRLRHPIEQLKETLAALSQIGVVHETPQGWVVTDFQKDQISESAERVKRFRNRTRRDVAHNVSDMDANARNADDNVTCNAGEIVACNAEVAAGPSISISTSTSDSISDSDSESISTSTSAFNSISDPDSESEGLGGHTQPPKHAGRRAGTGGEEKPAPKPAGEGAPARKPAPPEPTSPAEAMDHPDVKVYTAATGRIPGATQYRPVIETMRFLRAREKLDDPALAHYLAPYWLAWCTRKRKDGHPYDPGNLTWLTEWALNKTIPPVSQPKPSEYTRAGIPSVEQTRKMLDERDKILAKAVPPPPEVIAAMQEFKKKLAQGR